MFGEPVVYLLVRFLLFAHEASAADLTFAPAELRVLTANVTSKAALENDIC